MAGRGTRKSIFDPVHGTILLEGPALALVGTGEFQRLWGIRQTGFAHLVFPGANHTRLEHSLGTFWVAGQMADRLGLEGAARRRVTAAGLLHDLGHGPFSHTLDGPMVEVLGINHEAVSRARIEGNDPSWPPDRVEVPEVLERFGLRPSQVADLVDPARHAAPSRLERAILHGAIDADRIDYLQRDAHYTGVGHGAVDAGRLLETIREDSGRIAFAEKGRSAVEGFLVGRALMYSTVYYHKTVRAAEMMTQGAVERQTGFPEVAREQFRMTDGELLTRLLDGGGVSGALAGGLLARKLYKRAFGWRKVGGAARSAWRRLLRNPAERRAMEDTVAEGIRGPPGSVLVDLAGLEPRRIPGDEWGTVRVLLDGRPTFPFRSPSPWRSLAERAPADWAVSVYVTPRFRAAATRWLSRDPAVIP
ncbi:MAG TPA: HD domain-containing protein [Thermoplasmata archaeon]|nr:HD domain-containing protein [Thermoplasmata archaeon]